MISRTEFDALKREVNSAKVRKGVGYKLRRTGGGTVLDILPGKGGATSSYPFKVTMEAKPVQNGEPGDNGYQCWVGPGALMGSLRPTDFLDITGLTLPTDEAPTYLTLLAHDCVYLETTYDDLGDVVTTEVKTWGDSGTFDPTLEEWVENAYLELNSVEPNVAKYQTKSRIILAYTIAGETGAPELTQVIKTDLLLRDAIISGYATRYPVPHVEHTSRKKR